MVLRWPNSRDDWRLDIVSLLAVVGESAMSAHSQPLTASILCLLPRILPAPQTLLKPSRPRRLPPEHGTTIAGINSGNRLLELNHFASLIYDISGFEKFTVREVTIKHSKKVQERIEMQTINGRTATFRTTEDVNRLLKTPKGVIHARTFSPLAVLAVSSTLLSLGLLVWAILSKDGVAVIAITVMSLTSTVTGLSSFWHPDMISRREVTRVPAGDLVIRTRQGAFVIVRCKEEVARELYTGPEECQYVVSDQVSRALVGLGTFLLMVGVVLMGNCTWEMQAALGVSYVILNGCYQIAALLPKDWHWDFSRYEVEKPPKVITEHSYTGALWATIRATKSTGWIRTIDAAPQNRAWQRWLEMAAQHMYDEESAWEPHDALRQLLRDQLMEEGDNVSAQVEPEPPGPGHLRQRDREKVFQTIS